MATGKTRTDEKGCALQLKALEALVSSHSLCLVLQKLFKEDLLISFLCF